jgi:amino-acid N-acetyltransferase
MIISPALPADARDIQKLVNGYASKGEMLSLSLSDIYERIRNFMVARADDGTILGTVALNPVWEDLAEIRSLAVDPERARTGVGAALVRRAIEEAIGIGIRRIFVLTYVTEFFGKFGFVTVDKAVFPHKIWSDCLRCPNFPDCDEVAMQLTIGDGR